MPSDKTLKAIQKGIKSFFSFWKDFLVGDSPVLALGVVIIVGVAYLLRGSAVLAPISIIILVLVLMTFVVWQKTKTRRRAARTNESLSALCYDGSSITSKMQPARMVFSPCKVDSTNLGTWIRPSFAIFA